MSRLADFRDTVPEWVSMPEGHSRLCTASCSVGIYVCPKGYPHTAHYQVSPKFQNAEFRGDVQRTEGAIPGGHEIHMLQHRRYIDEITQFVDDLKVRKVLP
jgi:hypothetical protein